MAHPYPPQFDSVEDLLSRASARVSQILERERHPKLLQEAQHMYEDKYLLVEKSTLCSVRAFVEILDLLGMDKETLWGFAGKTCGQKQFMRVDAWQRCEFVSHTERKEEGAHSFKASGDKNVEYTSFNKVDEYKWLVRLEYAITVQSQLGDVREEIEVLKAETQGCEIVTRTDERPAAEEDHFQRDCDLSFIFGCLGKDKAITFNIDRKSKTCKTPRRNEQMEEAEMFAKGLRRFSREVMKRFEKLATLTQQSDKDATPLSEVADRLEEHDILIPVVPLLDEKDGRGVTFSYQDHEVFLGEFLKGTKGLLENLKNLAASVSKSGLPKTTLQFSVNEYKLLALMRLCDQLARLTYLTGETVEAAIEQQVIDSIGEICTAERFNEFMTFHDTKIYRRAFAPKPFVHEVRRHGHAPDGSLSLELNGKHVYTTCRSRTAELSEDSTEGTAGAMRFALNAAVDVRMYGQQNLHGLMLYQFSRSSLKLKLMARARQFSSFVLMIGTVSGPCRFEPKYSMVVRNKDDVNIPLLTKIVPSAQEFRDAIESLSPEQQGFAKAFREMQLGSTVMGIVLMPIRPLLEQVLQIPPGSLTKEIKLSQDLMELFVEYQIPSDLLTYAGPSEATAAQKVERVKEHVAAVKGMIEESKEEEAKLRKQEAEEAENRYLRDAYEETEEAAVYERGGGEVMYACMSAAPAAQPRRNKSQLHRTPQPSMQRRKFISRADAAAPRRQEAKSARGTSIQAETVGGGAPMDYVSKEPSSLRKEPISRGKDEWEEVEDEELVPKDALSFTQIPQRLDQRYREMEEGSKVRPVTLKPEDWWTRERKPGLIGKAKTETLHKEALDQEHHKTLDLLDALSRSGELPLTDTTLHVIIPVAHSFDKTVMETVVQENENPVHKLERTQLALNETIQETDRSKLLKPPELERLEGTSSGSIKDGTTT